MSTHKAISRSRLARPGSGRVPEESRTGQRSYGPLGVGLALALLMALTRLAHVGHDMLPLDASWAVFVIGGAMLPRGGAFFALCAEALAIDVVALGLGVDRACLSPAYVALLPAYAVLWRGGRVAVRDGSRSYLRLGVATLLAATAAFAITNAGYYLLSPDVATMRLTAFVAAVSVYCPWYVLTTMGYAIGGCALARWALRSPAPGGAVGADAA